MDFSFNIIVDLILFILPAYFSSALPVLLGGGTPIDLNYVFFDGKRLFGKGKTIRGFLAGVFGGTVVAILISLFYVSPFYSNTKYQIIGGFLLSLGAMVGDLLGSFIKRRVGLGQGRPFLSDSTLFFLISLIFVFPVASNTIFSPGYFLFLFILTIALHPSTNYIANKLGLKNVPW